jgi:arylsulfatase A-like enzyme
VFSGAARLVARAVVCGLLLLTASCDRPVEEPTERRRLFASDLAPDLLVESRTLALPPDTGGNRFLSGWWPWRQGGPGGTVVLAPLAGARVEIVQLAARPRTLALDLLDAPGPRRGVVIARHRGREVARAAVADPVELPLPADLPPGRVALDLAWELPAGAAAPGVVGGRVRPALPAGVMRQEGHDLVQAGESLVEIVRPVARGAVLRGTFEPPAAPRRGQWFELTVEDDDGKLQKRFRWEGGWLDEVRGARAVRLSLDGARGFVRVRLAAHGEGPPARWRGLALEVPAHRPPAESSAGAARLPIDQYARGSPRVDGRRQAPPLPRRSSAVTGAEGPSSVGPPPRLVIVYVMDALRADTVGHLGGPAGVSPVLDRLARQGLTFRRHRSVAPNTLPSTKSLFVGRTYVTRGGWTLLPEEGPTLAEHFLRAGYRTGLFSGNVHVSRAFGMDRGFEHVAEEVLVDGGEHGGAAALDSGQGAKALAAGSSPRGAEAPAARFGPRRPYNDNAEQVHAAALAWLRGLPRGARAFLYLHTIHPHNPYDPPEPIRSRFAPAGLPIEGDTATLLAVQHGRRPVDEAERRRIAGLYAGAFAYNDRELGRFLAALAAWARPRDTLLAVTSDHGEELFDHGGVLHGYTLYEEMLRIPLVLWAPGRVPPGTVERPTDTLDLRRRLLALCGLERPAGAVRGVTGRHSRSGTESPGRRGPSAGGSGESAVPESAVAGAWHHLAAASSLEGGIFSAQTARWKVIWAPRRGIGWGMGEGAGRMRDAEALFDLARDPRETVNRAGQGDLEAAWLRQRLLAWVAAGDGPAPAAPPPPLDEETRRRLRALGYAR